MASAAPEGAHRLLVARRIEALSRHATLDEGGSNGLGAEQGRGNAARAPQYSKPLPPMNSRNMEVGGTWSG